MNIAGNSQNSTGTYTYTWGFGTNTFDEVMAFHKIVDQPFLSEDIQFEQGILASIPHSMKIFVTKNEKLYLCLCLDLGSDRIQLTDNSEFDFCKISKLKLFNVLHYLKGSNTDIYDFEQIPGTYATLDSTYKSLHGLLALDSVFHDHDTVYLFRAGYLCYDLKHRIHVYRPNCDSDYRYHWKESNKNNDDKITHLSFEIQITFTTWNQNTSYTPTIFSTDDPAVDETTNTSKNKVMLQTKPFKSNGMLETGPFYLSSKFSDFTVQCGTKEFPVHKIILSNKSPVFETMFAQPLKEMETSRLVIEDSEPDIVEEFLRFLYTGEVSKMDECGSGLLLISDKYDVGELKLMCQNALVKDVCEKNIADLYNYGTMVNSSAIVNRCFQVLKRKRKDILKSAEDVENFSKRCPGLMLMLVNSNSN